VSKRKAIAKVLAAGLFASVVTAGGAGLTPSAGAQGSCMPYAPNKVGSSARVAIRNFCSVNPSRGQLQRYRGALIGWRVENSRDIPPDSTVSIYWSCAGVGTYTYRGRNTVGNNYVATGPESRFSC
jgi:hypothetical protein